MKLSIFYIPHLRKDISSYLSLSNIANCALVSTTWNTWFTPYLWHTISLTPRNPINTQERFSALEKRSGHVHSLITTFNCIGIPNFSSNIDFPKLTSLQYDSSRQPFHDLCFILENSPRISILKLELSNNNKEVQDRLVVALSSLSMLRKLDLTWLRTINSFTVQKILEAISHSVQDLRLIIQNLAPAWEWNLEEDKMEPGLSEIAGTALRDMRDTKIKKLSIELVNKHQEHSILIPFLKRCPQLVQLNLTSLHDPITTLSEIAEVFNDRQRQTRLKQLHLGGFSKRSDVESSIVGLLTSVGYERNKGGNMEGLEDLELSSGDFLENSKIFALTHYHSETLTELRIPGLPIRFGKFTCLMSGLYKLRTLETGVWTRDGEFISDELNAALERQWACCGLTEFKLTLELTKGYELSEFKGIEDPDWTSSWDGRSVHYLFSHISKLHRLKNWTFICELDFLCLDNVGYLSWMTRLKELESMYISQFRLYPSAIRMGVKEAQWMTDNWPSLKSFIYGMCSIPKCQIQEIENMKSILEAKNIRFGLHDPKRR